MIQTVLSTTLLTAGALLMLLASIGILRMPDVFLRMSASTKAATLGVILILLALAIHFDRVGVTARALGIIFFVILTGPVSAHMIARAAYIHQDASLGRDVHATNWPGTTTGTKNRAEAAESD